MHPRVVALVVLLLAGVAAGFVAGVFTLTLGSALIWGGIVLLTLAILARFEEWAGIVGPLLGWVYTIAVVVFLVRLIF